MGWEDRSYYRERGGNGGMAGGPLGWMLYGSVPLFTAFGIRVRAHASLVILCALILLLGFGDFGATVALRVQSVTALFLVILLHEFGHCFGARWTGGHAEEIVMTPLGGLAMTMARRRPWPTFVTVAAGPMVNVILCLICGAILYFTIGIWPLGPLGFKGAITSRALQNDNLWQFAGYVFWIYGISYGLLLFNLLPVFPLDGGQLLQSILWKPLGYYRSMIVTLTVGLVGSVLMFAIGLATFGRFGGGLLLALIAVSCFVSCFRTRAMMKAEGPWAFSEEDAGGGGDYGALSYGASGGYPETVKKKAPGWLAKAKVMKVARAVKQEADEQVQIDAILAKVSAQGMQSLTRSEKRTLQLATEHQRQRDLERQGRGR